MGAPFPTRLLVDLPNWVGDQVLALPAVALLAAANRGGETAFHTRPAARRLFELAFPPGRVVTTPPKTSPLAGALAVCRGGGRFDLGVTFRHAPRAKILLRLAARRAVGSAGGGACLLLDESAPVDRGRHQVHDGDGLLALLGLPAVDGQVLPPLPAELQREGTMRLGAVTAGGDGLVGLAPGAAGGVDKRWPAHRWGELARRLPALGLEPVLVIGPGETGLAAEVAVAAGCDLPVLGQDADVAGLAGLLSRLRLLVGNDSGPVHLAAWAGTPVVALFGPTDPARTGPIARGSAVLRAPAAASGASHLEGLTVDEVLAAVERARH